MATKVGRDVIALINDPAVYGPDAGHYFKPWNLMKFTPGIHAAGDLPGGKETPLVLPSERRVLLGKGRSMVLVHLDHKGKSTPAGAGEEVCALCFGVRYYTPEHLAAVAKRNAKLKSPPTASDAMLTRRNAEALIATKGCTVPHLFHRKCIKDILKTSDECPLCKTVIVTYPPAAAGKDSQETVV